MKKVCKIFIISLIILGCTSNDDDQLKSFCSVNDPLVDLAWLKAEIEQREQNITESSKYDYITQSTDNGEAIIIYGNCNPFTNSVFLVFNCEGENIGFIGDDNFTFEDVTSGTIIWKTKDFVCEL